MSRSARGPAGTVAAAAAEEEEEEEVEEVGEEEGRGKAIRSRQCPPPQRKARGRRGRKGKAREWLTK